MDIGFIGLGHMGQGVATSLLKAGHTVTVWNRSPEPVARMVEAGARAAETPADALQGDAAFSMLGTDEALEAVLLKDGALDKARKGLVHVCMATVSVALAQRLEAAHAERGLGYVAAPVLGRPDVAAKGELQVLCAGPPDAVAKVTPLLEAVGKAVWPLGDEAHRAIVVKIACNLSIASVIETLGEAAVLAEAWNVPRADLYKVMTGTIFGGRVFQVYSGLIEEGTFTPPGFALPLGLKDVRLALAAGEAKHAPLPLASLLRDGFVEALAAGDADKDWSALAAAAFRRAGRPLG